VNLTLPALPFASTGHGCRNVTVKVVVGGVIPAGRVEGNCPDIMPGATIIPFPSPYTTWWPAILRSATEALKVGRDPLPPPGVSGLNVPENSML